jgi:hypothetical protein
MAFIRKHILSATLLTVSGMVVPLAAQADVSFYAGAEAGYADIELEELKDSESYSAFLGIRFIDVIGVELGYGSLGEFEAKAGGGRVELICRSGFCHAGFHSFSWSAAGIR